jgi:hypothetical protein
MLACQLIFPLIFAFLPDYVLALTASNVQYITTARELLEQLGAEITPEGTSRYLWVSMFSMV